MSRFIRIVTEIEELQLFGIKLGLEQTARFFELLHNPQKKLKFIHIAGSNGKGSTAAILNAALQKVGLKVGFYSSPHLLSIRERFRINSKAISEGDFCDLYDNFKPVINSLKDKNCCPTFFEFTTAFAAKYFAEEQCDVVIWETGLGGRLDATNVVDSLCSVITNIALEHTQYLGETIAEIATEKAGIIKPNQKVFVGDLLPEALQVVEENCQENSATLVPFDNFKINQRNCKIIKAFDENSKNQIIYLNEQFNNVKLGLLGKVQLLNAQLAFNILNFLSKELNFSLCEAVTGFADAKWLGRLQVLPDGGILDGAHNEAGIKMLKESLITMFGNQKFCVVFGCFLDKEYFNSLALLAEIASEFYLVPVKNSMNRVYVEQEQLKEDLKKLQFPEEKIQTFVSVTDALKTKSGEKKLILGSLFLQQFVLKHYFSDNEII
ncbi:folylpolyglutamate synthase/dihydrofolate synthase family protein [Lentisphaerota bacterium WC36G]|nr:bifunctional folylpolyglutamate synthase/dihydrofolate synthase [Lentisphaerae bacterium WC36]